MIAAGNQLVAPTLLRSQLVSVRYRAVRRGELTKQAADRQRTYVRGLHIRLLGDHVLQRVAWKIADQLGWPDTLDAAYVALTHLQADALITRDEELATAVAGLVPVAPFATLHDAGLGPKA